MKHLSGKRKLNLKPAHRKALLRNQVIHFITHGHLTTTLAHVKEVRRLAERLVTIAGKGNDFNAVRKVKSMIPYSTDAQVKLFTQIAPTYVNRPGGYTRILKLGRRVSDTASIARLQWV